MIELSIVIDGGSLANGTEKSIGYGSFLFENTRKHFHRTFGEGVTNNEAEYLSLISALEHVQEAFDAAATEHSSISLTIKTDSQLVIGQLTQGWKVKATNLLPLVNRALDLVELFGQVRFIKISGQEMKKILGH